MLKYRQFLQHCDFNIIMQKQWVILKFGGSSVADPAHWQTIKNVIQSRLDEGLRPLLVLSALKNVSNALEALLHQALAGVHPIAIEQLRELHLGFASKLGLDASETLAPWFNLLESHCQKIEQQRKITPQIHAQILSIGELLSTSIASQYLIEQKFNVDWFDARQKLISSNHNDLWHHYTSAECAFDYDANLHATLSKKSPVIVTQGFIASDEAGETVLLGREGSDTSAAYLGAKLNAARIEIWTDVPGVFSANPREIPNAFQLPRLSYHQAQDLARLGAKVLHPRAIAPAESKQIPIWVKSTSLPAQSGSIIAPALNSDKSQTSSIMAIAIEPKVTWLSHHQSVAKANLDGVVEKIIATGFDPLIQFEDSPLQHFIFSYRNSDQPQPEDQKLGKDLNLSENEIRSNLALITLFATKHSTNQPAWIEQVITELKRLELEFLQFFSDSSHQRLCVLVDSEVRIKVSRLLHRQFIESAPTKHLFGPSWSAFQDETGL